MNSTRSSVTSENKTTSKQSKQKFDQKTSFFLQQARQHVMQKISNKYCICQNYITLSQINRTIKGSFFVSPDKQCILKTTLKDIKYDYEEQKIQTYYPMPRTQEQLPQLLEYYKYYAQKTIFFGKQHFPLLYQYHQKRKVIEYNRLKVLLNLSDSQMPQDSFKKNTFPDSRSWLLNRSKIAISRNFHNQDEDKKTKGNFCPNILDQLSLTEFTKNDQHEESLLINRLRNNLSKHLGSSNIKNMSIEELDKLFDFKNKNQPVKGSKENSTLLYLSNSKTKLQTFKPKKLLRQKTHTNLPEQMKQKDIIRRRSAKRNNSCQNLTKLSTPKNPYESTTNKLRSKKNLSMDNLYTNTSTPYMNEQRRQTTKGRKVPSKADRYRKENENTLASRGSEIFVDTIIDLKNRIRKEKEMLVKVKNGFGNFTSFKRLKTAYSSINNANQRFAKKNYEKLREKPINVL